MKQIVAAMLFAVVPMCGCGAAQDPAVEASRPTAPTEAPEFLPRPFTAEQIREEMVVGFRLRTSWKTSKGTKYSLWTVVEADAEGVEIEYADLDESGAVLGKPSVERSTWVELRDHASFPVAGASREETTRATPLGGLDGWVYFVADEVEGTTTEFFFAKQFPGAPAHMTTTRGDEPILEMAQLERFRPQTP